MTAARYLTVDMINPSQKIIDNSLILEPHEKERNRVPIISAVWLIW